VLAPQTGRHASVVVVSPCHIRTKKANDLFLDFLGGSGLLAVDFLQQVIRMDKERIVPRVLDVNGRLDEIEAASQPKSKRHPIGRRFFLTWALFGLVLRCVLKA